MSDPQSPLEAARVFRAILVERRRELIDHALAVHAGNGNGAYDAADIQKAQEQIDAVDRIIQDEEDSAPSRYEKRGPAGV